MYSTKKSNIFAYVGFQTDLPTAVKTSYGDYTPKREKFDTPSLKSPSRYSYKISEARESIAGLIEEVKGKRDRNNDAVERVKYVNHEAIEALNYQGESPYATTPKRSPGEPQFHSDYKVSDFAANLSNPEHRTSKNDFVTSYPSPKSVLNEHKRYPSEFYLGEAHNDAPRNLEAENAELRRALNEQIRINNELMWKMKELQQENEYLKSVINGTASAEAEFRGHPAGKRTAEWQTPSTNQVHSTVQIPSHSQIPSSILRHLEELKEENDRLRKDTIMLLQKQGVY